MKLDRFIAALRASGLEPEAETVADFFFLASRMPKAVCLPAPPPPSPATETAVGSGDTSADPERNVKPPREVPPSPSRKSGLFTSGAATTQGTMAAAEIEVPEAPALPGALEIARSLRPLSVRFSAGGTGVLDEEATAERTADRQQLILAFQPRRERWFDVALVVEDTPSMSVWKKTIKAFERMLMEHGAFRDVRHWRFTAEATLIDPAGRPAGSSALLAPNGRRIVLILTQGTSAAWESNTFGAAILEWARRQPTAVVQLLPERLWENTRLGEPNALARSLRPGLPNAQWDVELPAWMRRRIPNGVALPVLSLDAASLGSWAQMLMARWGSAAPSVFWSTRTASPQAGVKEVPAEPLPEDRLDGFRRIASEDGFRLATALAAGPVTLPVLRLVNQTLFGGCARQETLAQILLGGILRKAEDSPDPELVYYDFHPGVRDLLARSLHSEDRFAVRRQVTRYLQKHPDTTQLFRALVPHKDGKRRLPEWAMPFADEDEALLRAYGLLEDRGDSDKTSERDEGTGGEPAGKAQLPEFAPENTVAIIAGIERYEISRDWDLAGPSSDAVRFAKTLINKGVPATNVHLFLSALDPSLQRTQLGSHNVQMQNATQSTIEHFFRNQLESLSPRGGGQLLLFWCGHGGPLAEDRHLFCADTAENESRTIPVSRLFELLRRFKAFPRQFIFIEITTSNATHLGSAALHPSFERVDASQRSESVEQLALLAALPGDLGVKIEGLSRPLIEELNASAGWPEFSAVHEIVRQRLIRASERQPRLHLLEYKWSPPEGTIAFVRYPASEKETEPLAVMLEAAGYRVNRIDPSFARQGLADAEAVVLADPPPGDGDPALGELKRFGKPILQLRGKVPSTNDLLHGVKHLIAEARELGPQYNSPDLPAAYFGRPDLEDRPANLLVDGAEDEEGLQRSLNHQAQILSLKGKRREALELHKEEEALARQRGDSIGLAACLGNQAIIQRALGNTDEALALHREEEQLYRSAGDRMGVQNALFNQAIVYWKKGEVERGLGMFVDREREARELGDRRWLAKAVGMQGVVHQSVGRFNQAFDCFEEQARICHEIHDWTDWLSALNNAGRSLVKLGRHREALARLAELERLCRERESPGALQACLQNQGEAYLAEGDTNRALGCFHEQEMICERIGDLPGLGAAIGCQGLALQGLGLAAEALALRKREEAIARQLDDPDMLQVSLTYQAELLGEAGDYDAAFAKYSAADDIARRIHAWDGLRVSLGKSGALHEQLGQNAEALAAYREQQQLARDLGNRYAEEPALRNQARVLVAVNDLDGALLVTRQLEMLATDPTDRAREAVNQAAILDEMDRHSEAVDAARRAVDLLDTVEAADDVTAIRDLAHEILDR